MKSSAKHIQISSYDDLFKTDEERKIDLQEKIQDIDLDKLVPFPNHPFKVIDDEKMQETVDSINEYGVLVPIIVRPTNDGKFEIISGHRRHHASLLAGKATIPAIVRDMDDDAAILVMVDSNLQREYILPSEKAFAYKMKLEAMKRQAGRPKENCSQVGNDFGKKSSEVLAEQVGQSKNQIFRYIRLTELIPELIDMWKAEKKFADFINYEKVETYKDFGGIRNEEDYLITETGARRLGKKIPLTPDEVEALR